MEKELLILGLWSGSPEKASNMVSGFGHSSGAHCCPAKWCNQDFLNLRCALPGLETLAMSPSGLQFPHLELSKVKGRTRSAFSPGWSVEPPH